MGLIKMNKHLLSILCFTILVATGHTQQREPAWRIINAAPAQAVPDYANEPNPFPIFAKPEKSDAPEVDYEALKRAQDRAQIIAELRQVILNNNAYTPDFSPYKATGYLVGRNGPQALMGSHWVQKGDVITVNISGTQRILDLQNSLKELDPKAAKELAKDLARIVPQSNQIKTTVLKVSPSEVILQDTTGRRYTTPIK